VTALSIRIACFGGIYSNYLSLDSAIHDALRRGVDGIYCLGDLGAFGPYPDRTIELLQRHGVTCMQGNYDNSVGNELNDCQCGYTDARDNFFAKVSYDYTFANTSAENRIWMRSLPREIRLQIGKCRVLMSHGSPRRVNEFLWESTTSTHFLNRMAEDYSADLILATHTGIHWRRDLAQGRQFVNVGVLGRPENDGRTNVWYTLITIEQDGSQHSEFVQVDYDYKKLAREMREEKLPEEFSQTIESGWWTTCLEVLPAKERRRGKY
jgi:predicted phosphodiesterase